MQGTSSAALPSSSAVWAVSTLQMPDVCSAEKWTNKCSLEKWESPALGSDTPSFWHKQLQPREAGVPSHPSPLFSGDYCCNPGTNFAFLLWRTWGSFLNSTAFQHFHMFASILLIALWHSYCCYLHLTGEKRMFWKALWPAHAAWILSPGASGWTFASASKIGARLNRPQAGAGSER